MESLLEGLGVPGAGEGSGGGRAVLEGLELPRGSALGQQRGSAAPRAAVGRETKPCAVASHLAGCKTQDKL